MRFLQTSNGPDERLPRVFLWIAAMVMLSLGSFYRAMAGRWTPFGPAVSVALFIGGLGLLYYLIVTIKHPPDTSEQ
jgi:hypothetical protein